jgi:hypothetical protein
MIIRCRFVKEVWQRCLRPHFSTSGKTATASRIGGSISPNRTEPED